MNPQHISGMSTNLADRQTLTLFKAALIAFGRCRAVLLPLTYGGLMNVIRKRGIVPYLVYPLILLMIVLVISTPANAQDSPGDAITGAIVSSSTNSFIVRTPAGQSYLFVFARDARRPATLALGTQVRVVSSPGSEPGVRIANVVTVVAAPSPDQVPQGDEVVIPA